MSASEQLRELGTPELVVWYFRATDGRRRYVEIPAPLIADVVEAAEALDRDREAFGWGKEQHIPNQIALSEALAALRDALEEK